MLGTQRTKDEALQDIIAFEIQSNISSQTAIFQRL
jgi:hypothetical protein